MAKYKRYFKSFLAVRVWLVGLLLLMLAILPATSLSQPVYAAKTKPAAAKCGILDVGAVACPPEATSGCWYQDPGDLTAGPKHDGWQKAASCNSDIFQESINPQIPPSEDPALTPCKSGKNCDIVKKYLNTFIATLAGVVGIAVVISIIVGGIQYAASAGDPQKAAAARNRVQNALIALIAFFLLFALLSWLIPGGLLNG